MERTDWNIVILGAWNTAILTPAGVQRRLFQLEQEIPIQVDVPLDRRAPLRIRHDGIAVIPEGSRLSVAPLEPSYDGLEKASAIASRAIEGLPETPIQAVGVNIRYSFKALPMSVLEIIQCNLDGVLEANNHQVSAGLIRKSVLLEPGQVNIEIHDNQDGTALLSFNYHLSSSENEALLAWLGRIADFRGMTKNLLQNVFHLQEPGEMEQ